MCFLLRFPVVGLLADAFIALFAVVLFSAFAILLFFSLLSLLVWCCPSLPVARICLFFLRLGVLSCVGAWCPVAFCVSVFVICCVWCLIVF